MAAVSARRRCYEDIKISPLEATTLDPRGRIDINRSKIADMKHLEKVIESVKAVSGVLDVERIDRGPVSWASAGGACHGLDSLPSPGERVTRVP